MPQLQGIRFHGVLAPHATLRPVVVPKEPPAREHVAAETATAAECEAETARAWPHCISRALLLTRVSGIEMQRCPPCGAEKLKTIDLKWHLCWRATWTPSKASVSPHALPGRRSPGGRHSRPVGGRYGNPSIASAAAGVPP